MNITPFEEHYMKALQKQLEQREKTELIAMLQQMLRQEPDVQCLLTTPLRHVRKQVWIPGLKPKNRTKKHC